MPKPILLAVDDDTSVLEAVVSDLRRHYGQNYRIVRAASGAAALDISRQLVERKETIALFLSDQRMPGMTGVDFLQQAMLLFPEAKARPPDRLRRHRSRHPRHQRREDPLLPQQAVGSAGRKALPRPRRPAPGLEPGLQAALRRHPGGQRTLGAGAITSSATSSRATASPSSGSTRSRRPKPSPCSAKKASTTPACRSSCSATAPPSSSPPPPNSPPR